MIVGAGFVYALIIRKYRGVRLGTGSSMIDIIYFLQLTDGP
jgi:hypothetical protein